MRLKQSTTLDFTSNVFVENLVQLADRVYDCERMGVNDEHFPLASRLNSLDHINQDAYSVYHIQHKISNKSE